MLDAELLALLVCPETHQDVTLATAGEIAQLNKAIGRGEVRTVAGKEATPVEAALIRIDRAIAYPIREGIPVMLAAAGLIVSKVDLVGETGA
jgi:uncharacterized protein YbaR (Trm112 family)